MKTGKPRGKAAKSSAPNSPAGGSGDPDWASRIAVAAYYKAESRGFAPGNELDDWVSAETELKDWMSTQMEAESC